MSKRTDNAMAADDQQERLDKMVQNPQRLYARSRTSATKI